MKMSSQQIKGKILASLRDLEEGKITVEEARTRALHFRTIAKVIDSEIQHAKLTKRLEKGSDTIPAFSSDMGDYEEEQPRLKRAQ